MFPLCKTGCEKSIIENEIHITLKNYFAVRKIHELNWSELVLFKNCAQHFFRIDIIYIIIFDTGPFYSYTPSFRGSSVYVSNTTNRLDGTLCYKDNNFTLDTLPVVISTTCRLHGQYIMLFSKKRQGVKYRYAGAESIPNCEFVVYGNIFQCYAFFSYLKIITV